MTDRDDGLFADPEGLARDGWKIHDTAEYTYELRQWLDGELSSLGDIWGRGDEFANDMDKSLGVLKTSISEYIDFLVTAQKDLADYTVQMGGNYGRAEGANEDIASGLDPANGTRPGGGGRR
ncbi:hypothetical protein CQJ94_23185 [Glycomyces fuscus]|nr:hypothetical protein CQJ94_23185 [Glycomyces fuscus]